LWKIVKREVFLQDLAQLNIVEAGLCAVVGRCLQQHNYYVRALLLTRVLLAVTQLSCSGVAHYCDAAGSNTVVMFGRRKVVQCFWQ
jgi:hypothetical protein